MFKFCINEKNYSNIHFIGIGGISMSGLAKILISEGYKVSGSDSKNTKTIKELKDLGATIFINHSKHNLYSDVDLVIYTDAISKDNEELNYAINNRIKTIDRATFLGALIQNYKNSIAVSGTHGKTSTTSMIARILTLSELDPTILLGGHLDEIGGNVRLGNRNYLLTEACEYKGNVLKYFPSIAIILNIEADHLDYFRDLDHIVDTFIGYTNNIQEDGYLILNIDDKNAQKVIDQTNANVITFGLYNDADYKVENIVFDAAGHPSYDLVIKESKETYHIDLKVMGIHNIYNSVASIIASHLVGLPFDIIKKQIEGYVGTHRRLEFKGYLRDIPVIDDYAHHPTEIKVTLHALKQAENRVWCVFQPHTFTRTRLLMDDFSKAFLDVDKLIVTDIYAARELDDGSVHSKDLVENLKRENVDVVYIKDFNDIEDYLIDNTKSGDTIVTMGAGNVVEIGENILNKTK